MTTTITEEGFTLRSYFQRLFNSETRALIAWNLIIHKELTVKQLTNLINKDSSTITRNLRNLERTGLTHVSKTKTIRNLTINYWKLSSNEFLSKFGDFDLVIQEALTNNDLELMKVVLLAIQRNLENILNYKSRDINGFVKNILAEEELMSIGMMDKITGNLFRKELSQFVCKFQEKHKLNLLPIDEIGPESYFTFILASPLPKLENSRD